MTKAQIKARRLAATGYCNLSLLQVIVSACFLRAGMPDAALTCCMFAWLFVGAAYHIDIPKENKKEDKT